MARNKFLHAANRAKQDEFYTQLPDIEKELKHYRKHFRGKTVYCNCDDPTISNFFRYFRLNFEKLGLKRLITTCYKNQQTDIFSSHDMEAAAGVEYVGNGKQNPPYFNSRKMAISGTVNVLSCLNRQTLWLQIRRFRCSGSISRNWLSTTRNSS